MIFLSLGERVAEESRMGSVDSTRHLPCTLAMDRTNKQCPFYVSHAGK